MKRTITPFRITIILGDSSPVAQIENMESITEDDGTIILARALPAESLTLPLSESILGAVNAVALASIAKLETEIAELRATPQESPPTSLVAKTITALHAAFSGTLPPEMQEAFSEQYAIVRVLIEAEQWRLAATAISRVAVPPELEEAKAALIAIIPIA